MRDGLLLHRGVHNQPLELGWLDGLGHRGRVDRDLEQLLHPGLADSGAEPAAAKPAPATCSDGPNRSSCAMARTSRTWRANRGASAASICAQGSRPASTASGWRGSIISANGWRKKSASAISKTPRKSESDVMILQGSRNQRNWQKPNVHAGCGVLQGRRDSRWNQQPPRKEAGGPIITGRVPRVADQ